TTSAGVMVVQVAEAGSTSRLEIRGFLDELFGETMPVLLPFMLAALVIGILTIRHGLAPLAEVSRQVARLNPRSTEIMLSATNAVGVAAALAQFALRRSRSVAVSGEPGIALVRGNAEALRQAVRNLVENALQHTPPDTTVEVAVSAAPALQVIDRGPGVPASD